MPDPLDGDPPTDRAPWRPEPGSIADERDKRRRQIEADTARRCIAKARDALANPPKGDQ